jgi:hypothetical protein
MSDRSGFTATVVVGDKFKDIFNDILNLPGYGNCIKLASAKSRRFMYLCLDDPSKGQVEVAWDSVNGKDAIYVSIEGDKKLLRDMIPMINEVLLKHGFTLIDGEYEVSL